MNRPIALDLAADVARPFAARAAGVVVAPSSAVVAAGLTDLPGVADHALHL